MRLIEALERKLETEESYFQAHLLREDIARLVKMRELAHDAADAGAFRKLAFRMGWTAGDMRTHEIREPLEALADAIYACERDQSGGVTDKARETHLEQAWLNLHRVRMERLMGCLSTPLPKPVD